MKIRDRTALFNESGLYPVVCPEFCAGRPVTDVLAALLDAGVRIVQLRDKQDPARWAGDFRRMTARRALLIINDSLETALACGADGVHLGQSDMPAAEARQAAPELLIGVSTHNLEMALDAQAQGASYVNIGPIFPTATKVGARDFLGPGAVREIGPRLKIPFTVMGGIKRENISRVLDAGARHVAMVTALTEAADIRAEAEFFISEIRRRSGRSRDTARNERAVP